MDEDSDQDENGYYDREAQQYAQYTAMQQQQQHQQQQQRKPKRQKYQNQQQNGYNNHHHKGLPFKNGEKLYVGDKILLANKRSGKVSSLGPKKNKDGLWVRVIMDSADNADNVQAKPRAIWVPIQRVNYIMSRGNKFDLTVDDRVIDRNKNISGTIKYVGPTHFKKGVFFGVAYDSARGKHNGTVREKFYFLTEPDHGAMLTYKRLGKFCVL